jgi:diguanylate cyclase (GGDEF)-like protein
MSQFGLKRARRPEEIVEATRWLFAVLALLSLALALLAPLSTANSVMQLVALASAAVLGLSLGAGYLRKRMPLGMDVVDAVAILAFTLACPEPGAVFAFVFSCLWFRSLYGSTGRALLRCGLYVGALSATLPLWQYVPGHTGATEIGPLIGVPPTMFLTVIVGRHLSGILRAREEATRRDAVHASMGSQLLGLTDVAEIRRVAWTAIAGICEASPGLRVMKVVRERDVLRVDEATGGFAGLPATLPTTVLSFVNGDGETGGGAVRGQAELDAAVGAACGWVCIPWRREDTEHPSGWLLLGSPRKVPAEAIAAIGTLTNQVTLALSSAQALQRLTLQATLDSLTGLVNRASFNAGLASALNDESSDTTVLFIDLDNFKKVNDLFGHGAGDDLLQEVAGCLCRTTRPGDLCARLGGDEFAVLLHGTGALAAADVAQRFVESVAAIAQIGSGLVRISASVGVATATGHTNLEQLLHQADVAMYAAKTSGKARIQIFEPALLEGDSSQAAFERELSAAADNGQLVVHYQPVLSLPEGRCTAVEALVRWQHPERGLLHPDSFIETAERIGAIGDVGAYVLRRACADAASWKVAHPSSAVAIHVNISGLQLDDRGFIDKVKQCLIEFSLAPDQLVLEVTETVVISSPVAIDRLNILAAHGVRIAIDDFGTGYSALTTLRSLPAQIVKIDKSFVSGSTENPQDRAVIEAVVKMAAQMGVQTIAEGVETLQQQTFLKGIGADAVQGYLYLRPTTAEGFGTWLGTHLGGFLRARPTSNVVIPFTSRHTA